ncbi:hypothetical protein L6272_03515, partial [Microgenomates group bacterium]|nr:hypothetical protein [Microgenomates group bacterium]
MKSENRPLASHELTLPQLNDKLRIILINAHHQGSRLMGFSDFDNTLCDHYVFDPQTNTHLPQINPEISRLAKTTPLIIASARFADDPAMAIIARELLPEGQPVICENGGVIFYPATKQKQILAPIGILDELTGLKEEFDTRPPLSLSGQNLFTKLGETVLWLRMQDSQGNGKAESHQQLAWAIWDIKDKIDRTRFQVTSGGSSVIIQSQETSKKLAFITLLNQLGIDRLKTFVIGLGDAPNDEPIFQASDFAIGVKS